MTDSETAHQAWDETWRTEKGRDAWLQSEQDVLNLAPKLLASGARTVLDLGCGVGRHAIYLASMGFETWALDGSETGVKLARERADVAGVSIDFKVGLMTDLPYDDGMFDYVLSFNVIYHGDRDTVAKSISEIRRVLRPAGVFQGTMLSKQNSYYAKGVEISKDTFIYDHDGTGDEAHPHYYCDERGLEELFAGFEFRNLVDVEHTHRRTGHWHWHLVAERQTI